MTVSTILSDPAYEELRRALEVAHSELSATMVAPDPPSDDSSAGSLGETEHLIAGEQREIDSILSAVQHNSLRDVEAALARLADGTFGHCLACGQDIPLERLEAMPAAANCVRCQGAAEGVE